jgi:hypothetical protein
MKTLLATAAVLTTIASPTFARYYPQDYRAAMPSIQQKGAFHHYYYRPDPLDDPSLTGGGSPGYNLLLRTQ